VLCGALLERKPGLLRLALRQFLQVQLLALLGSLSWSVKWSVIEDMAALYWLGVLKATRLEVNSTPWGGLERKHARGGRFQAHERGYRQARGVLM
jgi:hypothetical protein